MKIFGKVLTTILGFSLMAGTLASCNNKEGGVPLEKWQPAPKNIDLKSNTLSVKKVENLSDSFIFGMDA